jgi:predicted DNA-binding transcriptional regulator YafY
MLLRLGAEAEVLAPAQLRQAIADTVTALALSYARSSVRAGPT